MNNPFESIENRLETIQRILDSITNQLNNVPQSIEKKGKFLTVDQCAEFLGLAKGTIYGMVHRGELPHRKRTRRIYFDQAELVQYLNDGRKETVSEIQERAANEGIAPRKRRG